MMRATTSSTPRSAISAWPASRPARPAASTTGATVPRANAYSVEAQFDWDALPPELSRRGTRRRRRRVRRGGGGRACREPARRRRRRGRVQCRRLCGHHPALVRRPPLRQSLRAARGGEIDHGDGRRQRPGDRSRQGIRHAPHRARFRRDALPVAGRPVDRNHPARNSTRRAGRTTRGNIRSRARATASGPDTTTRR